ncbi:MAG: CBS domain-containing protein [Myxococcales bacterium]|nr:CBS domain-containing protein [Myxococcales bacterium]
MSVRPTPALATVMTPFPYCIGAEASVQEAEAMMAEHAIRHLPVRRRGQIDGLLSAEDLALAGPDAGPVGDLCAPRPYIVDLVDPLYDVLEGMAERHAGAAIVLRRGKLAGILTTTDICRAFAVLLGPPSASPDDDQVA